jgi:glutamate racemase
LIKDHKKNQPIGVFDSGIGGLTVANAIISHLPQEEIIYFGDTAHLPYGDKSADAIRYYSLKIVKFLLEQKCKMIVIACNSASAAAYKVLLDFYEGQALFINVVDPLVEAVASNEYKKVGIIATKATISSGIYKHKLLEAKPSLQVESLATPLLAPMIEEGYFNNNISDAVIEKYLSNPIFENIDALLLACTHYPLIRKNLEDYFQQKVKVYDSTDVVAHTVRKRLQEFDLLNNDSPKSPKFFVSDYTPSFEETTRIFYKEKIELEYCPIW